MDQQHRKLVELLNRLHEAMSGGKVGEVIEPVLKELADYTLRHFKSEEQLMQRIGYPKFQQHKALHEAFAAEVRKSLADVQAKKTSVSLKMMAFLRQWLVEHIAGSDKEYGVLCKLKRVA
jgi:hemerythrin